MRATPRALALAAACAAAAACNGAPSPFATAQRIGSQDDAIGGPHAIGQIGDFLLENDQIRLVIADQGTGRVNTTFGGTLVDADLRRPGGGRGKGNDQLAELLPGFTFTVIDPTSVRILKDGADGGPAEILIEGVGGDLLQMISLLNTGLIFPARLTFRQLYRLHPGKRYVEIESTIINTSSGQHPLPYLDPSQLDDLLGQSVPGIGDLQLSVPMGQLPLFGGEQDLFAPGAAGFNIKFAIEDSYATVAGFPGFPGLVVDFLASRGRGVSYGLAMPASPNNYVNAYAASYPMQDITPHSMLLPFTYAGVAAAYMYRPPPVLQPNEEFSFTSYFVVGRGDVASVADTIYELRGQPTGTFGGRVVDEQTGAPVAGANVMVLDAQDRPVNQIETDAGGAFLAKLPPGTYGYTVLADDRLATPIARVEVAAGGQAGVHVPLPAPATLVVSAIDELGRRAPAKVTLVGRYDSSDIGKDPRDFLYSLPLGEARRPTAFDGTNRYLERAWWTKDGRLQAQVRPGTYDVVVSRGPEYELTIRSVELRAGAFHTEQVALVPAYKSEGWVAGDFHLHAQPSTDSGVPVEQRVISCAAEGLEVAVSTDHNYITDYAPAIAASGLDPWLLGIPGMELTTFEMGHFNAYPLRVDPGSTRGGEFVWAKQPPQQLFAQLRALFTDPSGIIQVNHPRQSVLGYFAQFFVDANTAEPYTPTGILGVFAPYGDEFAASNFSYDFEAIELLTGNRIEEVHSFVAPNPLPPGPFPDPQPIPGHVVIDADGRPTFPGVVDTWFTMLDRGHRATGLGVSDTHGLIGDEPGYARTLLFVGKGKDQPGAVSREDVVAAIRGHRAITTNGPFLEMTTAAGAQIGDTIAGASVELRIRVRAASWAKVSRLVVYSSSVKIAERAIPAAQGTDYETIVTVTPARDAWVVAEVFGDDNLFPIVTATEFPPLDASVVIQSLAAGLDLSGLPIASNLKPTTTHTQKPYAITNPIWIDVDGNGWTPPRPPLPKRTAPPAARPDVREQFEKLRGARIQ